MADFRVNRGAGKEPRLRGDERRGGNRASREWRSGQKGKRAGRGGERERREVGKGRGSGASLFSAEETGVNRLNYTASNQSAPQGQKGGRSGQDRQVQDRGHCPR